MKHLPFLVAMFALLVAPAAVADQEADVESARVSQQLRERLGDDQELPRRAFILCAAQTSDRAAVQECVADQFHAFAAISGIIDQAEDKTARRLDLLACIDSHGGPGRAIDWPPVRDCLQSM